MHNVDVIAICCNVFIMLTTMLMHNVDFIAFLVFYIICMLATMLQVDAGCISPLALLNDLDKKEMDTFGRALKHYLRLP